MSSSDTPVSSEEDIRPFEWLTNASSLKPLLVDIEGHSHQRKHALHVGCGSSTVGEYLVQELGYDQVVNVDKDGPTLRKMESRWRQQNPENEERMVFCEVDLVKQQVPYPAFHFDVVIDKSTLDCTLCSDEATAGLLCEVYRSLHSAHGTYIVISFHHVDLLLPLLRDCPGADWDITHRVISRQVEDITGNTCSNSKGTVQEAVLSNTIEESAWATGSFQPTEGYRRTVNVIICKRNGGTESELDREQVLHHVHEANDEWFQSHNPMLTRTRRDELQSEFEDRSLDLQTCYNVLFTNAEREHLTFEHFMEDWDAFLASRPDVERDCMLFDTAVSFLQEMQ